MSPTPLGAVPRPTTTSTDLAAARPLRICVFGVDVSGDMLATLRARAPAHASLALIGSVADEAGSGGFVPIGDNTAVRDSITATIAAARRFPGEDLIVVDADATVPELVFERLLRALEVDDVLGAFTLDDGAHALGDSITACAADAARFDALCFAYAERTLIDDASSPLAGGPCSAWHGERVARLGVDRLGDRDAVDAAGLRVVVLDHAYVGGGQSSAANRDRRTPSPLDVLRDRIGAALAIDAFTPVQPGLDGKPVVLHVLHGWGGGAERWLRDFASADDQAHHLVLIARGSFKRRLHGEWLELHDGSLRGPPLRRWPLPRPIADTAFGDASYRRVLDGIIADYSIDTIVVSSLIGHSLDVLRTHLPLLCIAHDHYPLWPLLHRDFGDSALAFDDAQLVADLAASRDDHEFSNRDPQHWRYLREATIVALESATATLIAPTRSALANHLRLAPALANLSNAIIAHGFAAWPADAPRAPPPVLTTKPRLLIPGRIRRGKGAELLVAALPRLREIAELFLIGAGADAHDLFGQRGVHIVLDYRRDALPGLVARVRPHAALLLPTVAETFSYTLSELRSLGVPVIATRIGALTERIEDGVDGFLVDVNADALVARVADLVGSRLVGSHHVESCDALDAVRARGPIRGSTLTEMVARYRPLLRTATQPPARYRLHAVGDGSQLERAADIDALATAHAGNVELRHSLDAMRLESERRGDWGHGLTRELTGARTQLDTLNGELEARTQWALSEIETVTLDRDVILSSRSWRLTQPLRTAVIRMRSARAQVSFRLLRLRTLARRVRTSAAQRGLRGTIMRIAAEFRRPLPPQALVRHATPIEDLTPIVMPAAADARISIVIPVHNKIDYTIACLRSIAEHAGDTPFEVIVVDDGSSDATAQRLAAIGGIRSQRNAENLGFVGSCNAGAAMARGEALLFLNNDTLVTAGWLEALWRCLEDTPNAGLVGAKLVYPDGRLQEAGGIVFNDGSGWNYGRFEDPADPRFNFRREVDYCSGAAILLRRALFERLGGFDARYAPAYYEDTDLAFAVRAAGYKVYYEPAATIVHFEGVTAGTDTASGTKRYQVINREKFEGKWQVALATQPAPGTPISCAATHRAAFRVLIVDATTPQADHDAGSLRMVNLMRVLRELDCQVSFLPDNRAWVDTYTAQLQAIGVEALYNPYLGDPVALFRERGAEFDLIILSRHYVAVSYVGLARLYAAQARLVFDTVDLHYLREQRAAELSGNAEHARTAAATRAQELKLIRECDVTLVVSTAERDLLATDAPAARVEILSTVNAVHGCRQAFAARKDLVFVGGFQHPPNTDAVTWFVENVFVRVRLQLPDVLLHIIGSRVPDSIRALADEHVRVHGFVEDITPYMDGCRISVAPLRYGAGVKGKINTAMSYGLPVVATTIAIEGMHVRAGEDVLVADSPADFADEIVRLYHDETLWNTLSTNGLANVEQYFSFAAARTAIKALLTR